ncbi:MAG: hypothetical protein QOF94_2428, partial [Acidobacteriaceae bacterium]
PPHPRFPEDNEPSVKSPVAAGTQLLAPDNDASQFPPKQQNAYPPAGAGSPFSSVPLPACRGRFRQTHPPIPRSWKPRFDAAASRTVRCAYASDVQLASPQLRLARIHHPRRQADRLNLFRRFSGTNPGEHSARGIRGQTRRSISYLRGRLNIAEDYCGYCLTLVTRVPVKRTNTVFDGGWP